MRIIIFHGVQICHQSIFVTLISVFSSIFANLRLKQFKSTSTTICFPITIHIIFLGLLITIIILHTRFGCSSSPSPSPSPVSNLPCLQPSAPSSPSSSPPGWGCSSSPSRPSCLRWFSHRNTETCQTCIFLPMIYIRLLCLLDAQYISNIIFVQN